jgi:hypothetical protein
MTLQTLADMVWSLGYAIKVIIYDPKMSMGVNWSPRVAEDHMIAQPKPPNFVPRQIENYNPTAIH